MSKLINKESTKLVRLDMGWHHELKITAAKAGVSIREFLERCLAVSYNQIKEEYGVSDD